mmetsp:Transcript_49879/g.92912  ORF Transcript_49879/g.92912 Transcript_49879/m.92912 type:complete len:86 (+) Transcript_49879:661-918(+)
MIGTYKEQQAILDCLNRLESVNNIACQVCKRTDQENVLVICGNQDGSQGCERAYHIHCMNPPIPSVPDDNWFCPECLEKSRRLYM